MLYILALILIVLDQWIKILIDGSLSYGQTIPVVQNIFHLTYVRNKGAGFGILQGQRELFIFVTIIIIVFLLAYRNRVNKSLILDVALSLIIAGAIGNLIDRIRLGYVIDYLDFRIWPVFNLADSTVVVGVVILTIYLWGLEDDSSNIQKPEGDTDV